MEFCVTSDSITVPHYLFPGDVEHFVQSGSHTDTLGAFSCGSALPALKYFQIADSVCPSAVTETMIRRKDTA